MPLDTFSNIYDVKADERTTLVKKQILTVRSTAAQCKQTEDPEASTDGFGVDRKFTASVLRRWQNWYMMEIVLWTLGKFAGQPIQTFTETLSLGGTGFLNIPLEEENNSFPKLMRVTPFHK